jgi:carboxyl-terminal processing protease
MKIGDARIVPGRRMKAGGEGVVKRIFFRAVGLAVLFVFLGMSVEGLRRPQRPVGIGIEEPRRAEAVREHEVPEVYRRTFEIVWSRVKETYYDPTFGGLDWDAVRRRYEVRLEAVRTEPELYAVLNQMLGELQRSHFYIFPPGTFLEGEAEAAEKRGTVGLDVRVLGPHVVITRVWAGSSAERAGLRPGFILRRVGDHEVSELLRRFSLSREPDVRRRMRGAQAVLALLEGETGTWVRLQYVDGRSRLREVQLRRERAPWEWSERFGNLPPMPMIFEARRIGDVGYIRFSPFVVGLMERIRAAIRGFASAPALIFDLRGNPGGIGAMAAGIAGMLCETPTTLGTMTLRSGHVNLAVFPQPNPYRGIVVIMIDGHTGSTAEIFAAGLQEMGRAVVVGERSVGAALPSLLERLPTGALFQYAVADFQTPKGVLIEGRGVLPDIDVPLTRRALLSGRDPQLEAALRVVARRRVAAEGGRARFHHFSERRGR